MKTLFLLRHAKSSWSNEACSDHERALSDRGRQAAPAMAQYMHNHDFRVDEIWISTATRTRQTYDLMKYALPGAKAHFLPELYGCSSVDLISRLAKYGARNQAMLVIGHNPCMEMTAWSLLREDQLDADAAQDMARKFPTCALAEVALPIETWRDLTTGSGELKRFVKPKGL